MNYKISEQVLKAVLNYLSTRPYSEVLQLITTLQASEMIEEPKGEPQPKKEEKK